MNRYVKLLGWEIDRFAKFYGVLLAATLLLQFAGVLLFTNTFMGPIREVMFRDSITAAEYAARTGEKVTFGSYSSASVWFTAPIALCAAVLLVFTFLIWYREWNGKNTFAYRLFMLPMPRMHLFLAKAGAILLFVLGLIAFQLLTLPLHMLVFNASIPSELRESVSLAAMIKNQAYLRILIPRYFMDFVVSYGFGFAGVLVVFTAILLERSYRIKGLIAGVVYFIAAGFLIFFPLLLTRVWLRNYFYPDEIVWMEITAGLLIIFGSLWFSSFLIRKKVTV